LGFFEFLWVSSGFFRNFLRVIPKWSWGIVLSNQKTGGMVELWYGGMRIAKFGSIQISLVEWWNKEPIAWHHFLFRGCCIF
jgi:hypothetical protein